MRWYTPNTEELVLRLFFLHPLPPSPPVLNRTQNKNAKKERQNYFWIRHVFFNIFWRISSSLCVYTCSPIHVLTSASPRRVLYPLDRYEGVIIMCSSGGWNKNWSAVPDRVRFNFHTCLITSKDNGWSVCVTFFTVCLWCACRTDQSLQRQGFGVVHMFRRKAFSALWS